MLLTDSGAIHMGHWKQLRVHLPCSISCVLPVRKRGGMYLFPSLLITPEGTSNRQFGQYHVTISSKTHRGHRIWWQSSQYSRCSRGKRLKLARGALGSNVRSSSCSISEELEGGLDSPRRRRGRLVSVQGHWK